MENRHPKKVFTQTVQRAKAAGIKSSVTSVSKLFGYKRQNYYKRISYSQVYKVEQEKLLKQVHIQRARMPRIGTRKLKYLLSTNGFNCGRDRLFGLLRAQGLLIKPLRRYIQTTNSRHWLKRYSNLIKNKPVTNSNRVWVSDITYIKTDKGTLYLSLITDKFSRKIVGFDLADSLRTEGPVRALKMALKDRTKGEELIHHSDRGIQYCSNQYQDLLKENGIMPSMTEKYDPYENALAERVNGILKTEFLLEEGFTDESIAQLAVKESIEIYNNERPHLSLKMKTPNEVYEKSKTSNKVLLKVLN